MAVSCQYSTLLEQVSQGKKGMMRLRSLLTNSGGAGIKVGNLYGGLAMLIVCER